MLHRKKEADESLSPLTEVIIAKNRGGPQGIVEMMFMADTLKFEEVTHREEPEKEDEEMPWRGNAEN